jgi:hypothetical protein
MKLISVIVVFFITHVSFPLESPFPNSSKKKIPLVVKVFWTGTNLSHPAGEKHCPTVLNCSTQLTSSASVNKAVLKMTAFWDVAPCILVEIDRRFRDSNCLHNQADGSEAVSTSEPRYTSTYVEYKACRWTEDFLLVSDKKT